MKDFGKRILIGIALFFAPQVFAEEYRLLVIPDNIVTENIALDSYIYNASAEFFADEIVTILNGTDYITAPSVSEVRTNLKKDPSGMLAAKDLTSRFRTSYNVDFVTLRKIASKSQARYALLLTSHVDAENYILRRTVWDFLNIPGASVIDPAYKISTYAVLIDTENNAKIWADTFYKTISVCENRIITRGPSPQTEQLGKIKDYSRYVCPQIARSVQRNILPASVYEKESTQIDYDLGNIDNVFTKKYRHWGKEYNKVYGQKKQNYGLFIEDKKQRLEKNRQERIERDSIIFDAEQAELESKLEVKATPVIDAEEGINNISDKTKNKTEKVKDAVYTRNADYGDYTELIKIEINKKKKKNSLIGDTDSKRPELRDYEM